MHINQCPSCAEKFARAKNIIFKKNPELPAPSSALLERILVTYKNKINQPSLTSALKTTHRRTVLTAIAATFIIALTIGIYLMFGVIHQDELLPAFDIIATHIADKKETFFALSSGDVITTKKSEHVRIALENRIEISVFGNSILSIDRSERDKGDTQRRIECILSFGKIHARIIDKTGIRLSFKSPQGTVSALGTEFIISVTADTTQVFLKEGTLSITHAAGKTITLNAGAKCLLTAAITISPMLPAEFENTLASANKPEYAKTHVPPHQLKASSQAKDTNTEKITESRENDSSKTEFRFELKTDAKKRNPRSTKRITQKHAEWK